MISGTRASQWNERQSVVRVSGTRASLECTPVSIMRASQCTRASQWYTRYQSVECAPVIGMCDSQRVPDSQTGE